MTDGFIATGGGIPILQEATESIPTLFIQQDFDGNIRLDRTDEGIDQPLGVYCDVFYYIAPNGGGPTMYIDEGTVPATFLAFDGHVEFPMPLPSSATLDGGQLVGETITIEGGDSWSWGGGGVSSPSLVVSTTNGAYPDDVGSITLEPPPRILPGTLRYTTAWKADLRRRRRFRDGRPST